MAMDEPPAQMSELDQIKFKMNAVTDESLDATRRMMALCEEVSHSCTNNTPIYLDP
ncbi:unnamed protein product [Hymenolepis diminuta]|uniref:Synaptosomal-associated protein n=1 Tax=Hymenolepis diminuta TaxID=6216 RepID=A0A564Z188_HYMDI|nr:unnamed protein product [Hymenolepis diminuta]